MQLCFPRLQNPKACMYNPVPVCFLYSVFDTTIGGELVTEFQGYSEAV